MSALARAVLALALAIAVPAAVLAQTRGSSGGGGQSHPSSGGGGAPAGGGGQPHAGGGGAPAPAPRSNPGFSFPRDVAPAPPVRSPTTARPVSGASAPSNRTPSQQPHAAVNPSVVGGPYRGTFHGPVVNNPRRWTGWGWNRGVPWYPAPIYWGGGFWGPFSSGGLYPGDQFGYITDYQDQGMYPSYQVGTSSPGAELLQEYGLVQTGCGPPNLTVIWGPGNSVICAEPNAAVAAGNYEVDPTTLGLVLSSGPVTPS